MTAPDPLHAPLRPPRLDPALWDGQLVRELLCVVYGAHQARSGAWVPDLAAVARRRRVSIRTVQRWMRPGTPPAIPTHHLQAIWGRRRPTTTVLRREQLLAHRTEQLRTRANLGRGRGNLTNDYAQLGWLQPHRLLVVDDDHRPLRRALIVRDDPTLIRRATRGTHLVDLTIADTKPAAEALRLQLLHTLTPWRINLTGPRAGTGHTTTWLPHAPQPTLPLTTTLTTT